MLIDVPYHAVKKNGRLIYKAGNRNIIGKSKRLKDAEKYLYLAIKSHMNKIGFRETLKGDILARYIFFFDNYETIKGKRSKMIPDLSNALEIVSDELQHAGVIEDDGDIVSFNGSTRRPGKTNQLEVSLWVIPDFGNVPLL